MGDEVAGVESPQTITLTNQETIPLQITAPPNTSGVFAESNNCGTLVAGASCQFSVTFSPSQSGFIAGGIGVTDNSPVDNEFLVVLKGEGSDFALNTTVGSASVNAGQTATYHFTVTSLSEFAGTVALSCSGSPKAATCSVNPNSVGVAADQSATFTLTVATTARTTSEIAFPKRTEDPSIRKAASILAAILTACVVCLPNRRKLRGTLIILFLSVLLSSCGGSGSTSGGNGGAGGGGGGGGQSGSGTPSGTYTLTITGTAQGISHSESVSLTVN